MKPLLVGESNPYGADPSMALYPLPKGASGDRLRGILGLTAREYLRAFDRCNLLGSSRWSAPRARASARLILAGRVECGSLILLGRRVATAFSLRGPLLSRHEVSHSGGTLCVVLLPHPSALNRMWNEPGTATRARELVAVARERSGFGWEWQVRSLALVVVDPTGRAVARVKRGGWAEEWLEAYRQREWGAHGASSDMFEDEAAAVLSEIERLGGERQ